MFFFTFVANETSSFRCEEIIDIQNFTKHLHTLLD
jgi:hypothetical protein